MRERVTRQDCNSPWRALPSTVAKWLRPELPSIADEMIAAIRGEVPDYARPMEDEFGAGLRLGVERALHQFLELIVDPDAPQEHNAKIFRKLGRGELREGRSLDALQAAYRVGARVAWRRYARLANRAGLPANTTSVLAEAVFTHINDMAAESAKGYAQAQATAASTLQRRRQQLLEYLLAGTPQAEQTLEDLASAAQWPLPATVACVVLEPDERGAPFELSSVAASVLVSTGLDPYLLVPTPEAPGREASLRGALHGRLAVLGPTVPLADARQSLHWARRTLRLVRRGAIAAKPFVDCAGHLGTLILLNEEHLARLLGERTLAALSDMKPTQRRRMESALLAWLTSTSRSAPEVANALDIHPQTVRYRMHQIMELFGDRLHNPDFRFEVEAALRARSLLSDMRNA